MVTMPGCTDSICKNCFKDHFEITIREKGVKHFNCPNCQLPNMVEKEATEGLYIDLFVAMVRKCIKTYLSCDAVEPLKSDRFGTMPSVHYSEIVLLSEVMGVTWEGAVSKFAVRIYLLLEVPLYMLSVEV